MNPLVTTECRSVLTLPTRGEPCHTVSMSTTTHTNEHRALGEHYDALADAAYTKTETTHDRALAWQYRRQAERHAETANFHYSLAGA